MTTPAVLDVHGVAEVLDCSDRHVYRLVEAGRIPPPVKLGALNKWPRIPFEQWLAAGCPALSAKQS